MDAVYNTDQRMIEYFINILKSWADVLPLPWFTFFGAMIEEIIAPIPSPLVMTLAGSLAASQDQGLAYILLLALFGTAGKTIGCYVVYMIARTFEGIVTSRFGKFIGITPEQVDKVSDKLGKGWKDNVAIFLLRATPIIPTAPVSIIAGLLRLDLKTYLVSSAAGVLVRNVFYLYLGYTSLGALEKINENLDSVETIGYVIVLAMIAGLVLYIYRKKKEF